MKFLIVFVISILSISLSAQNLTIEEDFVKAVFNKKTTKQELIDIKKRVLELGIHIDYEELKFNKRGKLRGINYKVYRDIDITKGSASFRLLTKGLIGFFYDDRPGAKTSFSIGSMKERKG